MALKTFTAKTRAACPYCFVDLNMGAVGFQCSGMPATGRVPCVPYRDFIRERVLNDRTPVLPPVLARTGDGRHIVDKDDLTNPQLKLASFGSSVTCDRCQGPTVRCICPNCHSVLPEALPEGSTTIGVVGARNSGKTVMLSMWEQQLMSYAVMERFGSTIDHPGGAMGLARQLTSFRQTMEQNRSLPDQTAALGRAKQAPSVYNWRYSNGVGRVITVYDAAGEDVADRASALNQLHLRAANAMVIVIDPFALGVNRHSALDRNIKLDEEGLTSSVLDAVASVMRETEMSRNSRPGKGKNKIMTPTAVVFTKMDAFWKDLPAGSPLLRQGRNHGGFDEADSQDVHQGLQRLLMQWGATPVLNKLDAEFDNYRMFSISALGNEPNYQNGQLASPPSPSRVLEPLLWLLHEQGFVMSDPAPTRGK